MTCTTTPTALFLPKISVGCTEKSSENPELSPNFHQSSKLLGSEANRFITRPPHPPCPLQSHLFQRVVGQVLVEVKNYRTGIAKLKPAEMDRVLANCKFGGEVC